MSTTANVDYISTNFEYPVLTKITGLPTYESLKTIKDELQANASTVQCDLGGGQHGHLGLVLSDVEYAQVSQTPYTRPVHPGANPPAGASNWQSQVLREQHHENIRLFREANGVEEALTKQLGQALPDLYLKPFRDPISNKITTPLRTILTTLFQTYGAITDEELEDKEDALRARIFDITQPMIHLFQAVEDLQTLATASNATYTDRQLVKLGLKLVKNMQDLEKGREKWLLLPAANQTWIQFKIHFTNEWNNLRRLRGPTMKDTSFTHHANLLRQEVLSAMQQERLAMIQEVKNSNASILQALSAVPSTCDTSNDTNTSTSTITNDPAINNINDQKIHLEMLKILQKIDKKLDSSTSTNRSSSQSNNRQRNTKYCWSHGACNHDSIACRNKRDGHKDEATFSNKLGGSTRGCKNT